MQVKEFLAEENSVEEKSVAVFNSLVVVVQMCERRSDRIGDWHGMQMVVVTRSIFIGFRQRSPLHNSILKKISRAMEVVEWCLISCETGMFSESK